MNGEPVYLPTEHYGWTTIPVLEFLWGKVWSDDAANVIDALRPSGVRFTMTGETKCDAQEWRVTVHIVGERIARISQEVRVGLRGGRRYGQDVAEYIRGSR